VRRDAHETVESILGTAREMLGMDIAYLSQFEDGDQRVREADGDVESFGFDLGTKVPLTWDPGGAAYLGVPVVLPDGELYGTLCCAGHEAKDLGEREVGFLELLARLVAQAVEREAVSTRIWELKARGEALGALIASLEARDAYTGDHSACVVELAGACACGLGCSEDETADIHQVALLHDIGKIGIPDRVLLKRGRLSAEEWQIMRRHPVIGARIIAAVDSLRHLAPAIRADHERFDGHGYPDGLAGEDIPLASRIVLACDAYHAMVSERPYRRALPPETAVRELQANAGTQFDPAVVDTLVGAPALA
jgi:HD-GYP domain-containing protein (c-di-GMP phosphodiesterase class II)